MSEADTLPRDHDAERYIIGALIVFQDRAGEVFDTGLTATDFFEPEHQKIFAAAQRQHAAGGIDPVLLGRECGQAALLVDLGINPHNAPSTTAHIPGEAAKIIEARKKRQRYDELQTLAGHAVNGYSSRQIDEQLEAAMYDWRREREATSKTDTFAFADLHNKYPHLKPPLIDGLARIGETINIIANPKVGKSWFTYYLALCVITGRPVFGRFATTPGRVMLVDNELHRETLAHRIPLVASAMGIAREEYETDLIIKTLRGNLRSFGEVACELRDCVESDDEDFDRIVLYAFDAKYRFQTPGISENDNDPVFYNEADRFATDMGACAAFVHHSSKGAQSEKRISDVGAGGGVQSRAADVHAIFREHEEDGVHVFEALVRSFAPVPAIPLRWIFPLWVPDDGVDPAMLRGRLKASEQRQSDRDREAVNKIVDALRKDGPGTARQLRPRTGLSRDRQQRLLDLMASEGQLTTSETTIRGNKCDEYALPKTGE